MTTMTLTLEDVEAYSVIYDFDVPKHEPVRYYQPPHVRTLWMCTEAEDHHGELSYAGLPKHRKYVALLTPEQFHEFVLETGLHADDVETMGSLGAPGFGYGWAPAICFNYDDGPGYANAYVTPIPKGEPPEDWDPTSAWDALKALVVERWGW